VIRPTGLIDPEIEIRPAQNQVDDVIARLRETVAAGTRALVTTLTKRMAEDLSQFLRELNFKVRYLHSDIDTLERGELIRQLRLGTFDILVGINLLREGLDIPEVALVAILDADKEGFLRSHRSLIQTSGRAARNLKGKVILYADKKTGSMASAMAEMERRRTKQLAYNAEYEITPQSIVRRVQESIEVEYGEDAETKVEKSGSEVDFQELIGKGSRACDRVLRQWEKEMAKAARELNFEQAAELRDRITALQRAIVLA